MTGSRAGSGHASGGCSAGCTPTTDHARAASWSSVRRWGRRASSRTTRCGPWPSSWRRPASSASASTTTAPGTPDRRPRGRRPLRGLEHQHLPGHGPRPRAARQRTADPGGLPPRGLCSRPAPPPGRATWTGSCSGTARAACRSFVREQRTMQNVSIGGAEAGATGIVALGLSFSEQTVNDLTQVDLRKLDELPCDRALVLDRPARFRPRARDDDPRRGARPSTTRPPTRTTSCTARPCPERDRGRAGPVDAQHLPRARRRLDDGARPRHGRRAGAHRGQLPPWSWRTAPSSVLGLGPFGLFGIISEPAQPTSSTVVVFVPDSFTPHFGPGPALHRPGAGLGRHRRADPALRPQRLRRQRGPAPVWRGHRISIPEHLDDVIDVVHAISPEDPTDVILIGVCSGAYLSTGDGDRARAARHRPDQPDVLLHHR